MHTHIHTYIHTHAHTHAHTQAFDFSVMESASGDIEEGNAHFIPQRRKAGFENAKVGGLEQDIQATSSLDQSLLYRDLV